MEEKLDFKALLEKYENSKKSVQVDTIKKENKMLKSDIKDKKGKIINVDYAIEQNSAALLAMEEKMKSDPNFAAVVENEDAILAPIQQRLREAEEYKKQLLKKVKEAEEKLDENNKKLQKPDQVYKEVVAEAETKTKTSNEEIQRRIDKLTEERKNYGVETKDKDGKPIRRITPEERIVIDNITEKINRLKKQSKANDLKLAKFKNLIEQMKVSDKTTGEQTNTEPTNAEPANVEQTNTEPVNTEPANAKPANAEQTNAEPVNAEPANAEQTNAEPVNAEPANAEQTNTEPTNAEPTNPEPVNEEKKLIEVTVNGKKYDFIYMDEGKRRIQPVTKLGFFKGLGTRISLMRHRNDYGISAHTAIHADPTIIEQLTEKEKQAYLDFMDKEDVKSSPFTVTYKDKKGFYAKALAKAQEKLALTAGEGHDSQQTDFRSSLEVDLNQEENQQQEPIDDFVQRVGQAIDEQFAEGEHEER